MFCLLLGSSCNAVCWLRPGSGFACLAWEGSFSCRTLPVCWWGACVPVLQQCRGTGALVCPELTCVFFLNSLLQLLKKAHLWPGPPVFCWWPLMYAAHCLTDCCDCSSCACTRHHMCISVCQPHAQSPHPLKPELIGRLSSALLKFVMLQAASDMHTRDSCDTGDPSLGALYYGLCLADCLFQLMDPHNVLVCSGGEMSNNVLPMPLSQDGPIDSLCRQLATPKPCQAPWFAADMAPRPAIVDPDVQSQAIEALCVIIQHTHTRCQRSSLLLAALARTPSRLVEPQSFELCTDHAQQKHPWMLRALKARTIEMAGVAGASKKAHSSAASVLIQVECYPKPSFIASAVSSFNPIGYWELSGQERIVSATPALQA